MSTGKGAEGSQQGRGSAGVTGKEVGEDRGSRLMMLTDLRERHKGTSVDLASKRRHRWLGTATHGGYTRQRTAGPLPRLEQPPCQDGGGQKVGAQKKVKVKGGPGGNWTERAAEVNGTLSKS